MTATVLERPHVAWELTNKLAYYEGQSRWPDVKSVDVGTDVLDRVGPNPICPDSSRLQALWAIVCGRTLHHPGYWHEHDEVSAAGYIKDNPGVAYAGLPVDRGNRGGWLDGPYRVQLLKLTGVVGWDAEERTGVVSGTDRRGKAVDMLVGAGLETMLYMDAPRIPLRAPRGLSRKSEQQA